MNTQIQISSHLSVLLIYIIYKKVEREKFEFDITLMAMMDMVYLSVDDMILVQFEITKEIS